MKNKCQDINYRKDHDYLLQMQNFKRKDMLLLSLYQEWVKRRYSKPTYYKSLLVTLVGMSIIALSFTNTLLDNHDILMGSLMLINTTIICLLAGYSLVSQIKD